MSPLAKQHHNPEMSHLTERFELELNCVMHTLS